ncbi:MAG: hypothetical protein ACI82A_002686 [Candidatus Azotimanducaceae bacterium]|jgi:hypothetical protein
MFDLIQGDSIRQAESFNPFYCERSEALEVEILTMAGQMNAAQYRFLTLLFEFDEHGGWQGDGIRSFAHWMNWKVGMGMVMAREKIRVARSLPDLRLIDEAFSTGKISYSKVRAMTRVANPENEAFLLQIAEYGTANHLEYLVKKYQRCKRLQDPLEDDSWRQYKELSWHQDETGMYIINARLPPEEGALVIKALEIIQAENQRKKDEAIIDAEANTETETDTETETTVNVDSNNVSAETFDDKQRISDLAPAGLATQDFQTDRASALTHLAESYLNGVRVDGASSSLGEKYQVFLHINANAASLDWKVSQADHCSIDHKHFLAPEVARRLACDASLTTVLEDDQGNTLNIGRRSRIVPRAMSHALRIRDAGCRYPGCTQNHYTDSHHIKHWAQGGETSMENLVTLCRFHHGLLHKGAYRLARDETGDLVFTNSRNEVISQSFYPQFPDDLHADDCLDPKIDERRVESKWRGDSMDIQQSLQCMFQLEKC